MALHFGFSKVVDYQRVTTDPTNPERWHPVADALVWLSVSCGFNRIDENNVDKVTKRIVAFQVVCGNYLRRNVGEDKPWQPIYITPADVRRFIGMWTNASTMTDAQFTKKLGELAMDQAGYERHLKHPSALSILGEYQGEETPA